MLIFLPRAERLQSEFDEIRSELIDVVSPLTPEEFEWAPREDMKNIRSLLREIGAEEKETSFCLIEKVRMDREEDIVWSGDDIQSTLADLASIRIDTLEYLDNVEEQELQLPNVLPEAWQSALGKKSMEPEELLRRVIRHEYYHLGQIITYKWILGHNPYKTK